MTIRLEPLAYSGAPRIVAAPERERILFELREIFGTIRRRKVWIAAATAMCLLAVGALLALSAPVYRSAAQIGVGPKGVDIKDNDRVSLPQSSDVDDAIIDRQVLFARSGPVLGAIAQRLGPINGPGLRRSIPPEATSQSHAGAGSAPELDTVVAKLRRQVTVRREETVGAPAATLVSPAQPSRSDVALRPFLLVGAALLLGPLVGAAAAVLFERLDGRIHSPGRLAARTGLQVLGPVPLAAGGRDRKAGPPLQSVFGTGHGSTVAARALFDALDALAAGPDTILLVVAASGGAASGSAATAGAARRAVSANLAFAEALKGRRTLLLDADDVHRGLARALMQPSPRGRPVQICTLNNHPSAVLAVSRLETAGQRPYGTRIHDSLLDGFRRVIVDLGGTVDDVSMRQLAGRATAVLIVAEAGVSSVARIVELHAMLARHVKMIGAVLVSSGRQLPLTPLAAIGGPAGPKTIARLARSA